MLLLVLFAPIWIFAFMLLIAFAMLIVLAVMLRVTFVALAMILGALALLLRSAASPAGAGRARKAGARSVPGW